MDIERQRRKAKRLQTIQLRLARLQRGHNQEISERYVETSHGSIRVLEFGFEDNATKPLYVDIHGGGFVLMTADSDNSINSYLQEKADIKIISIDYPKAPDYPFPIALDAIYDVVRYYIDCAEELNIDASRIGIGGHSAGANLATATCMRARDKGEVKFCFQVLDYPPLDLYTNPFDKPLPKKAIPPKMAGMQHLLRGFESSKEPIGITCICVKRNA